MKAISLPIDVIILIIIAVLVAVSVISFFILGWKPSAESIELIAAKDSACLRWSCGHTGLSTSNIEVNYDADKDGDIDKTDTLDKLCTNHYGDSTCKKACNC